MSTGISREDLEAVGLTGEEFSEISGTYEQKELMEMTHEFIKDYVLAVDRKASILMTGLFGLLGLGANAVNAESLALSAPVQTLLALAGTMGVLGVVFSAWVIYPRIYPPHNPGFIYWERIRQFGSRENFIDAVERMDDDQPLKEISKNVYNTSDIASRKYTWLRRSMGATAGMFYFASIAGVLIVTGAWPLAVGVPSAVGIALIYGLLAESDTDIAQSTATFDTGADGTLTLHVEADAETRPGIELREDAGPTQVVLSGLDPTAGTLRFVDASRSRRRYGLAVAATVAGWVCTAAVAFAVTDSATLALSVPSVVAVAVLIGLRDRRNERTAQREATFDVDGERLSLVISAHAATPDISIGHEDDTPVVSLSGLPADHTVHVTDPEKTPYDVFGES